jgi:hypothetical protein
MDDGRFRCLTCDKTMSNLSIAKTHFREKHSELTTDFPCTLCPSHFKIKRYLQGHMKSKHNLTQKQLKEAISF